MDTVTQDTALDNSVEAQDLGETHPEKKAPKIEMQEAKNPDAPLEQGEIMGTLIQETSARHKSGEIVEGEVIAVEPNAVFVNLRPHSTGIIYGREYINSRSIIRNINIGDTVAAKVVEEENEDGYVELSLKEARQAIVWAEAQEAQKQEKVFDIAVKEANKGGLILEWQGIVGFLPASHLKPEHYPRVEDGDKEKILAELKKLVGEKLSVSIITANPKEGKLIFSEKAGVEAEREEIVERYSIGDAVEGDITGIVDFGVFIKVEEGLEGLAHISELDWGLVEDPHDLFKVGQKVRAKVIEIKDGKISLSIKALEENPWVDASERYQKGQEVEGVIIKFNKHGALASIEEGVAGLVHISDFNSEEELRDALELGKVYPFTITLFEPEERRMALSYTGNR